MGLQSLNFEAGVLYECAPADGACKSDCKLLGMSGPMKRFIDVILTLPAILFLLPVFILVTIVIKLDGGSVFFRQDRIGRGGQRFSMLKFRTMHSDSDARLTTLLQQCPQSYQEWQTYQKLKCDPRITRVGDFLRRSSLDELPQLFNILKGDMSIVGQRPILPCQRDAYGRHIEGYERARPGLTGLWQVSGRNALTFQDRAALGSEYIRNWSIWFDVKLIALTIPKVLFSKDTF